MKQTCVNQILARTVEVVRSMMTMQVVIALMVSEANFARLPLTTQSHANPIRAKMEESGMGYPECGI